MRISELFQLEQGQAGLDFVDVDDQDDVAVFLDPTALRRQKSEWSHACVDLIQNYFEAVLEKVVAGDRPGVRALLRPLREPEDTHLGLSSGHSKGRGLGSGKQNASIADALLGSAAATSGLLADLEDTCLFVPGVGPDIISDMTTQIIRSKLVEYTTKCCRHYGIKTSLQYVGEYWSLGGDAARSNLLGEDGPGWRSELVAELPRTKAGPLLLVPRSIVRHRLAIVEADYYHGYVRPILENQELGRANSDLVKTLKSGERRVLRTKLDEKYANKDEITNFSMQRPEVYAHFKSGVAQAVPKPMTAQELLEQLPAASSPEPSYLELFEAIEAVRPGKGGATAYHRAAAALFSALTQPHFVRPETEADIHEGRRRLDLRFDNEASGGPLSFAGLSARTIPVEMKNFSQDISNPELDQLAGRFSILRGNVGFLLCREILRRDLLLDRCRDIARDGRGLVIPLDDEDLRCMTGAASRGEPADHIFSPVLDWVHRVID